MNDKLINPTVISITEDIPGRFTATSMRDDETTAQILFNLALNFTRKAAIRRHEESKVNAGAIINPATGLTMPKTGN